MSSEESIPADERALLNGPISELLVSGGDARMAIDERTGLNKYGCAPRPRQALPLGSCTSSSPTARGMERAVELQRRLRRAAEAGELHSVASALMREQRIELARWLGVDEVEGTRVILTPSGTDAELIPTWLALGDRSRSGVLCNIVAAPAEVGGGTTLAAGGLHFNPETPRGGMSLVGEAVSEALADRVRVQTITLRDDDGAVVEPEAFDAETVRQVDAAVAAGERVLLHLVAHSKTGAHAPQLSTVNALMARHGPDNMMVVVDAAQGRLSRKGLREVLRAGYIVLFTGSKFYGGPPFAGALILPPGVTPAKLRVRGMPSGVRDYFTAAELPTEWSAARDGLSDVPNIGLIVRWGAALAEIEAYYDVSAAERYAVLRRFEEMVPRILGQSPCVSMFSVSPPAPGQRRDRLLESKTTVFPFYVHRPGESLSEAFEHEHLLRIFRWVNVDVGHLLPGEDAAALRREYHIGQPVLVSPARSRSMLRVALGGPLVVRLVTDRTLGDTLDERLDWLEGQLVGLTRKLEILVRGFDTMAAAEDDAAEDAA